MNDPRQPLATDDDVRRHVEHGLPHTPVLLTTGPQRDQPAEEAEAIQAAHLRSLVGLYQQGHLALNGPVQNQSGELRGVSLYRSPDVETVRALAEADPAVRAGRLRARVLPWFGVLPD